MVEVANEIEPRVVRRFGSEATHVANVHRDQFQPGQMFGSGFLGVATPVAAVCGAVLRAAGARLVVCMQPGTPVRCRACARLSGWERAPEHNAEHPVSTGGSGG